MKDSGLRLRVDNQLKQDFLDLCKSRDETAAQVLRKYMRDYLKKHNYKQENTKQRMEQ
jgi:hypothetical protein